jgi:hypothetical protein
MKITKTQLREIIREEMTSLNEARKSKDTTGVRFAEAVYNNVSTIESLVLRDKKDVSEVLTSFATPLLNSIKATLQHNYKPNPQPAYTSKRDIQNYGDYSNEQRIVMFKKSLKELQKVAEDLIKRPSKVGVTKLVNAHREWWNNNYGANIGLNGKLYNSIIESKKSQLKEIIREELSKLS